MRHLLLALGILLTGCSDDDYGSKPKDLATPSDAGVTLDAAIRSCDVLKQDCPSGQRCTLVSSGASTVAGCAPATGTAAIDQPCTSTDTNDSCQTGLFCSSRGWPTDANGPVLHCNKLCAQDSDCRSGEACTIETDDGLTGACVKRCQPFDSTCPAGMDCATGYDDTDSTDTVEDFVWACRSVGTGAAGANCSDDTDCLAHFICDVSGACSQLCDTNNLCVGDGGLNCESFDGVTPLGICQ